MQIQSEIEAGVRRARHAPSGLQRGKQSTHKACRSSRFTCSITLLVEDLGQGHPVQTGCCSYLADGDTTRVSSGAVFLQSSRLA